MGFQPVGVYRQVGYKFGAWHDVAWFAPALAEHERSPVPPIPLPDALRDPAVARIFR